MTGSGWSDAQVRALPAMVPLITAAEAIGIKRTTAYALNASGGFPISVLMVGGRYFVRRSAILAFMGIADYPVEPNPHLLSGTSPTVSSTVLEVVA